MVAGDRGTKGQRDPTHNMIHKDVLSSQDPWFAAIGEKRGFRNTYVCKYVINIYRQLNDISTADKYQTTLISILLRKLPSCTNPLAFHRVLNSICAAFQSDRKIAVANQA